MLITPVYKVYTGLSTNEIYLFCNAGWQQILLGLTYSPSCHPEIFRKGRVVMQNE